MVLLCEQVRRLAPEGNWVNNGTAYNASGTVWTTVRNYGTMTLDRACCVISKGTMSPAFGGLRLSIGSYYVHGWTFGVVPSGTLASITWIPAGTHAVVVEGIDHSPSTIGTLASFQMGTVQFADEIGTYGVVDAAESSGTWNLYIANRKTPLGSLVNAMYMVNCVCTSGTANWEDAGESTTPAVTLEVGGTKIIWKTSEDGVALTSPSFATWYGTYPVGGSVRFVVTKESGCGTVHVNIYACPWLLRPVMNKPIEFKFTQNATAYMMTEPLVGTVPIGTFYIGKPRAISFGTSTDYYYTQIGTLNVITKNSYTYELVAVADGADCFVTGEWGCISVIGCDMY